jgi:hypothetical protein
LLMKLVKWFLNVGIWILLTVGVAMAAQIIFGN